MGLKSCNNEIKKETTIVNACWVMELPTHLLLDILSGLPMEAIFSCRCVCKKFLQILTDPYFAKLHLSKAPKVDHSLIVQDNYYPSEFSLAYISDIEKFSASTSSNNSSRLWRNLTIPTWVSRSTEKYIAALAGSCNGLLCITYAKEGLTNYYICNPILDEFMLLPKDSTSVYHGAAFGFCLKTKQYKVMRFINTLHCEIHTLGTDYWRRIENVPYPNSPYSFDSSLNGNLHWITTSSNISKLICSLNLETECFHFISPPPHFNQDTKRRSSSLGTGEIGGLFCVSYVLDETQLEVFVMKEYDVHASWTKEFTINLMFNFVGPTIKIPLALLSNGDLLVRYNFCSIVYYSSRKGILREVITRGCHDVVAHAPSFVSLKDIGGDNYVEVVRRNKPDSDIKKRPFGIN